MRCILLLCFVAPAALAGPPFLTDDADPVDLGHFEAVPFYSMDRSPAGEEITGPGMDFNYGIWPEVQLNLAAGFIHSLPDSVYGLGDMRIAAKWRFVQESDGRPELAIYPAVILPTGNARRGLGNGQVSYQFPLWIEKNWGDWTSYGGAGYGINRAPGARNNFFGGWQLQKKLNDTWYLGGEIYAQGADADDAAGFTALNVGGGYALGEHVSLIFTAGHSVAGESHALAYLGLFCTWGPAE